jgi:hypothetical protein
MKPLISKVPITYSLVLVIASISIFLCILLCIIHSLGLHDVKDIWFFQDFAIGAFTFIGGFLMGGNLSK